MTHAAVVAYCRVRDTPAIIHEEVIRSEAGLTFISHVLIARYRIGYGRTIPCLEYNGLTVRFDRLWSRYIIVAMSCS